MKRITITIVTLFTVLTLGLAAQGATEHCPDKDNPNKVENAESEGDLVFPEGTVFCAKKGQGTTGQITADGETTLYEYLFYYAIDGEPGEGPSYYIVYEEAPPSTTTTTTSIPETTTTTVAPTTTVPEETTTTIEDETSSTSLPDNTTTTPEEEPTTTQPETTDQPDELPYTGGSDLLAYFILSLLLLAMGGLTLAATRKDDNES